MDLYYVSLDCRAADDVNNQGVYGLKYSLNSGIMHVQASSEIEAKEKALKAVEDGIEPHYVSVGGSNPSSKRVTAERASVMNIPFVA